MDFWRSGDPRLVEEKGRASAIRWIEAYQPEDSSQQQQKSAILKACHTNEDVLIRSCFPGLLTASALVIDDRKEKVLLHHHAKLERWLQFGGHCDGDGNLAHAAWRMLCIMQGHGQGHSRPRAPGVHFSDAACAAASCCR